MADPQTNRESAANASPSGVPENQGEESRRQPDIVLPGPDAEPSDDAPTVISKSPPGQMQTGITLNGNLGKSLRGRTLAHFELVEPIGVGGMAAVIRARDKQLDRFVALKILPPEMSGDAENVRRFHQEARAAAKLDHENIARVFFCGEDQNLHFIAFEFVEGENLRAILERRGKLPVPEAVRYLLQIATGLEHAAARGVVHRDIKPSNIIITPTGRAKLVDMGLARSLGPHDDKALTQSGVTLGTFDYISPEQALEPREADARSDIYSLGCTFYHMLTGQPPVPEGTAAKKLHHHQHVAPIDPRQLNPEIPDEIAAILARMMAKDAKDRYQRPLHLVQHLMQAAQNVGAATDVPEGVLFVDTPLPNTPRKRPLLMAALAASFLGSFLFLLSLAPLKSRPVSTSQPESSQANSKPKKKTAQTAREFDSPSAEGPLYLKTRKDLETLAGILAENDQPQVRVIVDCPLLDLTGMPLVFKGKVLLLEGKNKDRKEPPTLKLKYQPDADEGNPVAGILVEEGKLICSNLRFEVESNKTPEIQVAAVLFRPGTQGQFDNCTFTQKGFPEQALIPLAGSHIPLASVAIDNADPGNKEKPRLVFKKCYLETGQDALALNGAGDLMLVNCAFGPHGALVHLRGKNQGPESDLRLINCSAFVVNGPAFRLDEEARCSLHVDYSIFSCPENSGSGFRDELALIRQTDAHQPRVKYFSKHNCYHNLQFFWSWPQDKKADRIITNFEEFKKEVVNITGIPELPSEQSLFLPASTNPWAVANPLKEPDARSMFQVNPEMPEIRHTPFTALGVESCVWGNMRELKRLEVPVVTVPTPRPHEKIVDPDATGDKPGVYKTLAQALAHKEPGDVIFLKHSKERREVEITPAVLDQAKVDLTIKPYEGFQPILILGETREPNAAFFKLYDGKLRLENLEILLRPAQPFKSQAVVSLSGNGKCIFKQCLFTLFDQERVPLCVVVLENPENAMKMGPKGPASAPKLRFQDCFVRGQGELVQVQTSRPFGLEIDNSLIALNGHLLSVQGNAKDTPMEPGGNLKLNRVSAFLTKPLINLRASSKGKGLAITKSDAKDCLFVSLLGKPLIFLDGVDVDETRLKEYLEWSSNHNAYSGFERVLDQQPLTDIMPISAVHLDEKSWKMNGAVHEDEESRYEKVLFVLPPPGMRPLSQAVLDDFKEKAEPRLRNFGANLSLDRLPPLTPSRPPEAVEEEKSIETPP